MLKGCQKKIIFLKNTGSDIFEEAYFVIKHEYDGMNTDDIVCEATKIANKMSHEGDKRDRMRFNYYALFLSVGMLIGVSIAIGCFFLFG